MNKQLINALGIMVNRGLTSEEMLEIISTFVRYGYSRGAEEQTQNLIIHLNEIVTSME